LIYTDNIHYNLLHTLYHSQGTATCFDQHVAIYKEYTQRVDLVKMYNTVEDEGKTYICQLMSAYLYETDSDV